MFLVSCLLSWGKQLSYRRGGGSYHVVVIILPWWWLIMQQVTNRLREYLELSSSSCLIKCMRVFFFSRLTYNLFLCS